MMTVLLVGLVLVLAFGAWHNARCWRRERERADRLHAARIHDNDLRAIDNERWAERVEQARELARLAETAEDHIRNALTMLRLARAWETAELVAFNRADLDAIDSRLMRAIGETEHGR